MSGPSPGGGAAAARIDRWLFAVRLFKSRSLAAQAVSGGRVHLNGVRVKPAHEVRCGDCVSFVRDALEFECRVRAVPARRGPAAAAQSCYEQSAASQARAVELRERLRIAGARAPRPAQTPDKRARRQLRRLRGRI